MNKYEITKKIEEFATLELAEKWDCSGWLVETDNENIQKVMLCLTVTNDVVKQAIENNCDMIISHHPLFLVPLNYHLNQSFNRKQKSLDIYCAHTNMDRTQGGTTDTLIKKIFSDKNFEIENSDNGFVRFVKHQILLQDFVEKLKTISPHLKYVNNKKILELHKIAFCAGSGTEFINDAYENGAEAFVTGDLKFHTALDSPIIVFDIGHFESEIMILDVFEKLLANNVQVIRAKEKSPFIY